MSDDATWASHPTGPRTFDQVGVMGIVARERRSINVPDVRCEGRFLAPEWFRANGFTSCYGIPGVADGSVLAVLNFNGHAPFVFRSSDAEALRAFVTQAATAIRNAWRYEDVTITHRRLAESLAQLVHSENLSALGQLVAGVAHELNNPLAAMLGYAYLAELKDDAATLKRYVGEMRLSAERAAQIVRNLLQFARETPPTRENVDVNELVERGLQVTANTLVTNNITIVRDLDPAASVTVGDIGQLQQVLFNLVTNAYQAMIGAGGTLTVRTRSTRDGVRIEVADSGPGVPADVCAKIFDPFFMTKPVGNRHRARLSAAHGVVTSHRGRIWLDDAASAGAAFVVEFPVAGGEAGPERSPSPPIPSGRRILVVDDEPPVAKVLADLLSVLGSTVTVANSARQAREHLDRERYDLVTLDLVMPGESGADFFRALRARDPRTAEKVVVVTGAGEPGIQRFDESTGRLMLAKPFTFDRLSEILHRALTPSAAR